MRCIRLWRIGELAIALRLMYTDGPWNGVDRATDALGREPIDAPIKAAITQAFRELPDFKTAAFPVRADSQGNAVLYAAAKIGDAWKVAGGVGIRTGEKRPAGYLSIEAAW